MPVKPLTRKTALIVVGGLVLILVTVIPLTAKSYFENSEVAIKAQEFVRINESVTSYFGDLMEMRFSGYEGDVNSGYAVFFVRGSANTGYIKIFWASPIPGYARNFVKISRTNRWGLEQAVLWQE